MGPEPQGKGRSAGLPELQEAGKKSLGELRQGAGRARSQGIAARTESSLISPLWGFGNTLKER